MQCRAFTCIQRYKDGLIQRRFVAGRTDTMNALGVNKCDFWESETHRQIVSAGVVEVYEYGEYKRKKNVLA